jgi:hypothetical protein
MLQELATGAAERLKLRCFEDKGDFPIWKSHKGCSFLRFLPNLGIFAAHFAFKSARSRSRDNLAGGSDESAASKAASLL